MSLAAPQLAACITVNRSAHEKLQPEAASACEAALRWCERGGPPPADARIRESHLEAAR
jgi:hypothetical protein